MLLQHIIGLNRPRKIKTRLLVQSHGGSATSAFMEFIQPHVQKINCINNFDYLKHTSPENTLSYNPTHILYIYGDMCKAVRSLFRRKGKNENTTFAAVHKRYFKNIEEAPTSRFNKTPKEKDIDCQDYATYIRTVLETQSEPIGCIKHIMRWERVPNVFFIHYEHISTSDKIDAFLGVPKGTCSKFIVLPRNSVPHAHETPEYIQTMAEFDKKIAEILRSRG